MTPTDYGSLLQAVIEGNNDAFSTLIEFHRELILRVLRPRLNYKLDGIEDAFQEVIFHVWKKRREFPTVQKEFEHWLAVTTFRKAIENVRKNSKHGAARLEVNSENSDARRLAEPVAKDSTPSRKAAREENRLKVDTALLQLSDEDRFALLLKDVENMSYVEIGQMMEMNENQAKNRVRTARKRLKAALGPGENFLTHLANSRRISQ